MACQVRPRLAVVIGTFILAVFVGVGFLSYHLTQRQSSRQELATAPYDSLEDEGDEGQLPCTGSDWKCNIRLDPNVYPIHYHLFLFPDFESGLFSGNVSILVNISTSVDHIRLHSKYLNISDTSIHENTTGARIPLHKAFELPANEYWVVKLESSLSPGIYRLNFHFHGSLTRGIVGFYRSQYYDPDQNTTKFVVSSKFQSTYARRAFPCFDEPSFKSKFTVTLVKPSHLVALSNMPVELEESNVPGKDLTLVRFQESIPMVTYLLAFAIGDFAYREGVTKTGIPVRIYATSFKVQHTEYAAEITPKMLDFFEEYFGINYPLPKLDVIGVPDFVSGAMEHWGMISFREVNLLFQPGVTSPMFKQRIASVISHELAHMWFGNLATLKWWDDLWLNEGFASYMEYGGMNYVHPDWDIKSQFVCEDLADALNLDSQLSSHPIVQPVSHPDQITEIFDKISYNKGASVIRMLESFMGPKNFQLGVSKFLKKFAYKNAITDDLWDALQWEAPLNINISLVMETWTRQMGYPLLTITNGRPNAITISQERFFGNPSQRQHEQQSPFGFKWEIPLLFSTSVGPNSTQLVWLPLSEKSVTINLTNTVRWVKVNTGQLGYFRVKYDSQALSKIAEDYISKFSPEERCGLLDDVFSLAFAQYTTYDDAFQFALQMTHENHVVPWRCAEPHLRKILALLNYADANVYSLYRKYMHELTQVQYRNLPWTDSESEPHLQRLLKPRIFSLSCEEGIGDCRNQAKSLFFRWLETNQTIPISLRAIVYKWGIAQSNETVWDLVWEKYQRETDAAEKVQLLQALAYSQENWIILRLFEYAKNETLIRKQDYFNLLRYIAYNPVGNPVLWNYYRNEWSQLKERFGTNDRSFGRIIKDITEYYCDEVHLQELENFYKVYPVAGAGTRARESAYEKVQNNVEWVKRSLPMIRSWLESHDKRLSPSSSIRL